MQVALWRLRLCFVPLCPKCSVEGTILDGFTDMVRLNVIAGFKIGDGASDFEDAIIGTGAELELIHGHAEEAFGFDVEFAEGFLLFGTHSRIAANRHTATGGEAVLLGFPDGENTLAEGCGGFAQVTAGELLEFDDRDLDVNINAIEKRARDAVTVLLNLARGTATLATWVAKVAAGTGHRVTVSRAWKKKRKSTTRAVGCAANSPRTAGGDHYPPC